MFERRKKDTAVRIISIAEACQATQDAYWTNRNQDGHSHYTQDGVSGSRHTSDRAVSIVCDTPRQSLGDYLGITTFNLD